MYLVKTGRYVRSPSYIRYGFTENTYVGRVFRPLNQGNNHLHVHVQVGSVSRGNDGGRRTDNLKSPDTVTCGVPKYSSKTSPESD